MLTESVQNQLNKSIVDKVNCQNVFSVYNSSEIFNDQRLAKLSLSYIKRCFALCVDCPQFLELDYFSVVKLVSSSGLHLGSDIEVFNAITFWLSHNFEERKKHAKSLVVKFRLNLISDLTLNRLLTDKSYFKGIEECFTLIKTILQPETVLEIRNNPLHPSRYCNQDDFNIILVGGYNCASQKRLKSVLCIDLKRLDKVKMFPDLEAERDYMRLVCIKNELYAFQAVSHSPSQGMPIEKYSFATEHWEVIGNMHDARMMFCTCSIMNKCYAIGGLIDNHATSSCVALDTSTLSQYREPLQWRQVSSMNAARFNAGSAVFEGKVVVSGGYNNNALLNTVEAYDHVADDWSNIPNMIERRNGHKLVAVSNKLFVIGGHSTSPCEVFDSTCKQFISITPPFRYLNYLSSVSEVVSIGAKLVVFGNREKKIVVLDLENYNWSEEVFEVLLDITDFGCVKVPQLL